MKKELKKKSFVFNIEWQEILLDYPAEVRLEVYDAIIEYVASGTLSELKPMAKMAFSFIKKEIDYNSEKYDAIVAKRSLAGKKGMEKRYGNEEESNKTNTCYQNLTNLTYNDNVNDNVIVNENDNIIKHSSEIVIEKEKGKIDYKSIVDEFNSTLCPPLSKVISLSEPRKKAIKARIGEHGVEGVKTVFENVKNSRFLKGEEGNGWKCYFDWIFNPRNFLKILEGNYADTRAINSEKQRANDYAMQQFISDRIAREQGMANEVEKPF